MQEPGIDRVQSRSPVLVDGAAQSEGIEDAPADAVVRAEEALGVEVPHYESDRHTVLQDRVDAILHVVEREQRSLEYKLEGLSGLVGWLVKTVQGLEGRKRILNGHREKLQSWQEASISTQEDVLHAIESEVEKIATLVESTHGEVRDLPKVHEMPHFPDLSVSSDIAERKYILVKYLHDFVVSINVLAKEASDSDQAHLYDLLSRLQSLNAEVKTMQSDDDIDVFAQQAEALTARAYLEHELPEVFGSTEKPFEFSREMLREQITYYDFNARIIAHEKYYQDKKNTEIIEGSEQDILDIRSELRDLYNMMAANRDAYTPDFFKGVVKRIRETYVLTGRIEQRRSTGIPEIIEDIETTVSRIVTLGVKKKDKVPKRRTFHADYDIWPENMEYHLNDHGEDYVLTNSKIGAMIVADGNTTFSNSAETARRITHALMDIFNHASAMNIDEAEAYILEHLSDLPASLEDLEDEGGSTIFGSLYFPEVGQVLVVDIGDCEAYLVRNGEAQLLPASINEEKKTQGLPLNISKDRHGGAQIGDIRKNKVSLVRRVDVRPNDILVIQSDGPRNNIPRKERTDERVAQIVYEVIRPMLSGDQPARDQMPTAQEVYGDDEVVAIQQFKAV